MKTILKKRIIVKVSGGDRRGMVKDKTCACFLSYPRLAGLMHLKRISMHPSKYFDCIKQTRFNIVPYE